MEHEKAYLKGLGKNCPYCGKPFEEGRICAAESRVAYWLPKNSQINKPFLSTRAVEEVNGQVIGKASKLGFFQTEKVLTGFCKSCHVLITFMD